MAQTKTVTATTTESSITFECFYPYVWIRNLGENDVYASCNADIVAGAVDVSLIKSGEVGMVQTQTDTVYVKATGTTTLECRAQGFAECPFKCRRGGGGGSITIDNVPTQGSTNAVSSGGVYNALQDSPIFWVNITEDAQGNLVSDKTVSEMLVAYEAGKLLVARLNAPNQQIYCNKIETLQLEGLHAEFEEAEFIWTHMSDGVMHFISIVMYENGYIGINDDQVTCD